MLVGGMFFEGRGGPYSESVSEVIFRCFTETDQTRIFLVLHPRDWNRLRLELGRSAVLSKVGRLIAIEDPGARWSEDLKALIIADRSTIREGRGEICVSTAAAPCRREELDCIALFTF